MKKPKACRYCGMSGHLTTFCWAQPKKPLNRSLVKRLGKHGRKWLKTRAEWFAEFPPDWAGFYTCYICGGKLTPKETTLDHVLPRSSRPDLKYEFSNLRPCCWKCNMEKGSKHGEAQSPEEMRSMSD